MAAAELFDDFYELLEISPSAHPETVHRVYRLLAQTYHPDNRETGSEERFRALSRAYQTLSDPTRRAAYDAEYRARRTAHATMFRMPAALEDFDRERAKRYAILVTLYRQRGSQPEQPGLNPLQLEKRTGCPREEMELALWYLRESGCLTRSDNGQHALTVKGVEALERLAEAAPPQESKSIASLPAPAPAPSRRSGKGRQNNRPRFVLTKVS